MEYIVYIVAFALAGWVLILAVVLHKTVLELARCKAVLKEFVRQSLARDTDQIARIATLEHGEDIDDLIEGTAWDL